MARVLIALQNYMDGKYTIATCNEVSLTECHHLLTGLSKEDAFALEKSINALLDAYRPKQDLVNYTSRNLTVWKCLVCGHEAELHKYIPGCICDRCDKNVLMVR